LHRLAHFSLRSWNDDMTFLMSPLFKVLFLDDRIANSSLKAYNCI
jgi:hypothetical protein